MEIYSFLHLNAKRLTALIVAAALAAMVTGFVVSRQPAKFRAEAIVFTSQVFPSGSTNAQIEPFVADFQTVLGLGEVVDATSEASGVSPGRIRSDLKNERIDAGTNLLVTFEWSDAETAETVVRTASERALEEIAQQELTLATDAYDQAVAASNAASAALTAFEAEKGYPNMRQQYDQLTLELLALQTQIETAPDAATRAALQRAQAAKNLAVQAIAPLLPQQQALADAVQAARADVQRASEARSEAQARLAAAQSASVIVVGDAMEVGQLAAIARGGLAAAVLVAAAGLLLFALIDRRRDRAAAAAGSEPSFGAVGGNGAGEKPAPATVGSGGSKTR